MRGVQARALVLGIWVVTGACAPRAGGPAPVQPARAAAKSSLRCAPLVNDPAWLYAAGQAEAATVAQAERVARERALGELARGWCATVRTQSRSTERERDGRGEQEVEDTVEVTARIEGLTGVEEVERTHGSTADGAEACVILRLSRIDLDARRREDEAQVSAAVRASRAASQQCPGVAIARLEEVRAGLTGLCGGVRGEGVSVEGARALVAQALTDTRAREGAAARRTALGVACSGPKGEPRACPRVVVEHAQARLTQLGETLSGTVLTPEEAAAVLRDGPRGLGAGRCDRRLAVLALTVQNQTSQRLKAGAEHFAVLQARWVGLDGQDRREGEARTANGGGYAAEEALVEAAKRGLEDAPWPLR